MIMNSDEHWESFGKRYDKSFDAIFKVAQFLHGTHGLSVEVPKAQKAPNRHVADSYKDFGDIIIHRPQYVEVKHKTYHFTCAEDFPFRDIIVANKKAVDRNWKAYAYFIVNKAMTHAAIIKTSTKDQWYIKEILDKERNSNEEKYMCPIHLAKFVELK
jgi:hypothetical protein